MVFRHRWSWRSGAANPASAARKFPHPVVDVLATKAFMSTRPDLFRRELIAALHILDSGDVEEASMRGSWAGAMGQPQFMPSSFLQYAVDFDGDGRRDIWNSVPDSLASIANYLVKKGWQRGRDWGFEVSIPGRRLLRTGRSGSCPADVRLGGQGHHPHFRQGLPVA